MKRMLVILMAVTGGCREMVNGETTGAQFQSPTSERMVVESGEAVLQVDYWGLGPNDEAVLTFETEYEHAWVRGAIGSQRRGMVGLDCSGFQGSYLCEARIPTLHTNSGCSTQSNAYSEFGRPLGTTITAHIIDQGTDFGPWVGGPSDILALSSSMAAEIDFDAFEPGEIALTVHYK